MDYKTKQIIARRKRRIFFDKLKGTVLMFTVIFGILFGIYLTQADRLNKYEQWRGCMYKDWNYEKCDNQVYSK